MTAARVAPAAVPWSYADFSAKGEPMTTQPARRPPVALADLTAAQRAALGERVLRRYDFTTPIEDIAADLGLSAADAYALAAEAADRHIDRLVAAGVVTPARRRKADVPLPPPVECRGGLSDLVIAGRR